MRLSKAKNTLERSSSCDKAWRVASRIGPKKGTWLLGRQSRSLDHKRKISG